MQLLREKNIFLEIEQSEKMKNLKSQNSRNQETFPQAKAASCKKQQENPVSSTIPINESFDLDKLILCEGKQPQNEIVIDQKEALMFLDKSKKLASQSFDLSKGFQSKQQQLQKQISSGILKLQSDQVKKQALDIKLQDEELAIIQEDIRSNRETVNQKQIQWLLQKKQKNYALLERKNELFRNNLQQECLQQLKQKKFKQSKKFIKWFIIILFLSILVAGALQNNIPRRQKKNRK